MGVTPTKGGPIPLYIPRIPSALSVFLTTSSPPVYVPSAAVCRRVLVRSKGWPTRTADTPPKPPERKDLRAEVACFFSSNCSSVMAADVWSSAMMTVRGGVGCVRGGEARREGTGENLTALRLLAYLLAAQSQYRDTCRVSEWWGGKETLDKERSSGRSGGRSDVHPSRGAQCTTPRLHSFPALGLVSPRVIAAPRMQSNRLKRGRTGHTHNTFTGRLPCTTRGSHEHEEDQRDHNGRESTSKETAMQTRQGLYYMQPHYSCRSAHKHGHARTAAYSH